MKDKETLHRKVLELVDCYATTDPLKEMSMLKREEDGDEAPLKWVALAVLHGINAGAKEISMVKTGDGGVRVGAEYRKAELPNPGAIIGKGIFESLRRITHLDGDKGTTVFAMGVRESSIDLRIKIERKGEAEKLTLIFPEYAPTRGTGEGQNKGAETGGESQSASASGALDYCRFAADAEHERANRVEEPCDDARSGGPEQPIKNQKRAR